MKHLILTFTAIIALSFTAQAQSSLSLEDCYSLARDHYPTIEKLDLIAKTEHYTLANANRAYLPQLSISGQATYQSETTDLSKSVIGSLPLPAGVSLPAIDKDQYRAVAEVSQLLYASGAVRSQKQIAKAQTAIQAQTVETQLYSLRQRVSNLYFGALLISEQLKQNRLNTETLESQLRKAEVALTGGVTLPSNVAELKAEILRLQMQATEYEATQATYLKMLSTFVGKEITSASQLAQPAPPTAIASLSTEIRRPELRAFSLQESLLKAQEKQLTTEYLPKLSAFFQGAYGKPTLNMLSNEADFYYIAGVRLQWNLSPLYNLSSRKRILRLSRESLTADRRAFLLNTELELTQQSEQLQKLQKLLSQDEQTVALRHSVAEAAEVQLDNGVITTHEYLQKRNTYHLAQQTLILHQIQLLQALENHKIITGQ
ncbi:transporter [Capnocytophaga sp. HP1101]